MAAASLIEHPTEWTRQRARLWTGRSDDHPVGTIEQGRRFRVIGTDGAASRGFRTLLAAQQAAERHDWVPVVPGGPSRVLVGTAVLVVGAVVAALGGIALLLH